MEKSKKTVIIDAKSVKSQYWRDIWAYRDLLYFLSWRDILVRYKQTVIGLSWAVIRPLLTMVVFTVIFGRIAQMPSNNLPYPLLVFAAMLPWYFFSSAFAEIGNSLIANSNMISKVYFPRILVPLSTIAVCFLDLLISFVLMLLLMAWYGVWPSARLLTLPVLILIAALAALGPGLWCAALNVRFRDFRYIIPFVTQIGLYISPVGFSSSLVPEQWRLLYYANPMVAVIDGFRWSILGSDASIYWPGTMISLLVVSLLLVSGVWYFRRTENTFADVI